MKQLDDIFRWLGAIESHTKNAPEGATCKPSEHDKYTLRDVDPEAIKEFMKYYGLQHGLRGHRDKICTLLDSTAITVLDFIYPFPKKKEECGSFLEYVNSQPGYFTQARYRLLNRESVYQNQNGKTVIEDENGVQTGAQG